MTPEEEEQFKQSSKCWMCEKPFDENKVRDRDHLTGKYRGAACNTGILNQDKSNFVAMFFHNFRGYDCHFEFEDPFNKSTSIGIENSTVSEMYGKQFFSTNKMPKILIQIHPDSSRLLSSSLKKIS